ncbi:MAG: aminotransferase class I/II-fold pyridoxal phosphate-dependent enzyme [Candidatus Lokiarchaeota archaeon]|nr:aminotransferase class I/II-fold pyridoxal phosphate-dependent enzyme [Candidatus Lokiarchaeota archaeon]MBD3343215.1 aminotransferase class I/II-fold pyridoxal phosphate-dependent enzyme [Candidatus Lokiarchaeota archaeon]
MPIHLDKNEMPNPPPDYIRQFVKDSIDNINRYTPQEEVAKLKSLLSDYSDIPEENIILSSGSDILIKEFIYLFAVGRKIIIPDPTFVLIKNSALKTKSQIVRLKLKEPEFQLPLDFLKNEINEPTLIVVDTPNNPTGKLLIQKKTELTSILENENNILLIDEAYYEFSKSNFHELIAKYPNFAISRTLSKAFGLAGSGIGYILAGESVMEKFKGLEIMLPFPSVQAGTIALENQDFMLKYIENIKKERKRVLNKFLELGITGFPSYTNFFLVKTQIPNVCDLLRMECIYVLDLAELIKPGYFRVSIGTENENDIFIEKMSTIMNKN